ncbi:MAG: DNA adenine methylase [Candidatus Omnitrophota bacterium]
MSKPILPYPGGKSRVAPIIAKLLPPHKVFIEPFLGAGSVFFEKPLAKKNVLSDLNKSVFEVHRAVKAKGCAVLTSCAAARKPTHELSWKAVKKAEKESAGACETFVASKSSRNSNFSFPSASVNTFNQKIHGEAVKPKQGCAESAAKLKRALVLNQDFRTVLKKYDSKDAAIYMDPPYGKLRLYKHDGVTPEQVCQAAKTAKGKVLISYSNTPGIRKACKGLHFMKLPFNYTSRSIVKGTKSGKNRVNELLIANYKLPKVK